MDPETGGDGQSGRLRTHSEVDGDVGTLAEVASHLDGVEAALARIDAATYGRCTVCGEPIDDPLLDADPTRLHCSGHSDPS